MKGKDHEIITMLTIAPFIIPFLLNNKDQTIEISLFIIFTLIGSILPDADAEYSKLQSEYKLINTIMNKINLPILKSINSEKKEEHRGIFHSLVGVLINSTIITIIIGLITIIILPINLIFILIIFLSLIIGQSLHLLEDSTTYAGIKWLVPFSNQKIKGTIKVYEKKEKRINLFKRILIILDLGILIGLIINNTIKNIFLIELIITILISIAWYIILKISKRKIKN